MILISFHKRFVWLTFAFFAFFSLLSVATDLFDTFWKNHHETIKGWHNKIQTTPGTFTVIQNRAAVYRKFKDNFQRTFPTIKKALGGNPIQVQPVLEKFTDGQRFFLLDGGAKASEKVHEGLEGKYRGTVPISNQDLKSWPATETGVSFFLHPSEEKTVSRRPPAYLVSYEMTKFINEQTEKLPNPNVKRHFHVQLYSLMKDLNQGIYISEIENLRKEIEQKLSEGTSSEVRLPIDQSPWPSFAFHE